MSSAFKRASPRMIPDWVNTAPGHRAAAALRNVSKSDGVNLTDTNSLRFSVTYP